MSGVDLVLWITGAAVWTCLALIATCALCVVIFQASVATATVVRALLRIQRGAKRAPNVTISEAWRYAFWNEGVFRP